MSLKYLGQYDFKKTNSGGMRNMVIYNLINEQKTKMRKYSSNRMRRKYKKKKSLRERQESESLQEHLFFLSSKAKHIQVLFT